MNPDPANTIFQQAVSFVNQTSSHLFLSGKAGTGKTTFLKYIKEHSFKKMAIVAPTGVAAINAGGVTIHSLFQLPVSAFIPTQSGGWGSTNTAINNRNSLLHNLRLRASRRDLLRELELLIIDEVSMVRADLLDAVDTVLRHVRKQPLLPFGGVQMVYIGDLFQLPPVVKNDEWQLLQQYYNSPFFFDACVMQQAPPVFIELKKIYRQKDEQFINILNKIRNNQCSPDDLNFLDRFYKPGFIPAKDENYITLTSHNSKADAINETELGRLPAKVYTFNAEVTGEFEERIFPAEKALRLKEGAQVMFIKNDKGEERRYYNGKIGTVEMITGEKIVVRFKDEDDTLELEKEEWQNIRYDYDKEKDTIEEEKLGTFSQYPVRLAWAITIHKSQGLTFVKAIVDAGSSFAPGQVYVALSRLTGLQGLVLHSRISPQSISTHSRAALFVQNEPSEEELKQRLEKEKHVFIQHSLLRGFNWGKLVDELHLHLESYTGRQIPDKQMCIEWSEGLLKQAVVMHGVGEKFAKQLQQLFTGSAPGGYEVIHTRTTAAADYFTRLLDEKLVDSVKHHSNQVKGRKKVKKYVKELQVLLQVFERKKLEIRQAVLLSESLCSSVAIDKLLEIVSNQPAMAANKPVAETKKPKLIKGETGRLSLQLYKKGKSIADIAAERNLAPSTIEGHLASFVAIGEIDVLDLVEEEKLQMIVKMMTDNPGVSHSEIKKLVHDEVSYGQLRAVSNYLALQQNEELAGK